MSPEVEKAREMKSGGATNKEIARALGKPVWWVTDAIYRINRREPTEEVKAALRDIHSGTLEDRARHGEKALNAAIRLHAKGERL